MTEQPVIVQKISWSDLCPWTVIFKTLPIASSVTVLAFALLGSLLTPAGWLLSETLFIDKFAPADANLIKVADLNRSPYRGVFPSTNDEAKTIDFMGVKLSGPRNVFQQLVTPFQHLFSIKMGMREFMYLLFGCAWSVLVWSFVGLAITRVSLLKLTRNEQSGLDDAFEFALEKWTTAASAVSIPMAAVAVLCIPAFLIGLIMGFDFGVLVAGILWFVVIAIAAAIGLLLLGLMFGWPLMVSSVSCESQNAFDAMTRAYAYTYQRPLHYLFYCLIAILFGGFCWMIVASLTDGIVDLSFWATSWGANIASSNRLDVINGVEGQDASSMLNGGRTMIGLWTALFRTLSAAFLYGLFWCMASAVYLLLRKDVDETEMDEIYIVDEKRTYELPPLKSDENGIPQVQEPRPVDDSSDASSSSGGEPYRNRPSTDESES